MDLYTLPNVTEPPRLTASSLSVPSVLLVTTLTFTLISLVYWCVQDYRLYMSLGPGGPPYNICGWILTSFLVRPFTLAADETTWTGDYPGFGCHKEIDALPERSGTRPTVLGIAPQRQFTQSPGPDMNERVSSLFMTAAQNNSKVLQQRISEVERHHVALFVHPSLLLSNPKSLPETAIRSGGELGHLHGETSLHLYFSPADAKVIIDKGWAERHRCARTQPWWFGSRKYLWSIGDTFLLVYAPRDEDECAVLKTLIRASARFMTGQEDIAEP